MKGTKHNRILILMIISQVLLTLFVIHWLTTQYRNEKGVLVKELTGFWIDSRDQVLDSLVFINYVNPVLSEKNFRISGSNVNVTGTGVSDSSFIIARADSAVLTPPSGKEIITIRINQKPDTSGRHSTAIVQKGMSDDFLIRSVKMIVSHAGDSSVNGNKHVAGFRLNPDTSLFKKNFSTRLSGAGMKLNIEWKVASDTSGEGGHKRFLVINPDTNFPLPEAAVAGYSFYLAGRIMPQIVFGLILIIITAIAFTLSYKSIRQQFLLNKLRNEFISNITHELKTPVATLSIAMESLRHYNMQSDPVVLDEYLRLASQETKRLEELINRVLDHSMLEENSTLVNLRNCDLVKLIAGASEIMKKRLPEGGTISVISSSPEITVNCDELFLKGVVINLIDNGIRYCDKVPHITISSGVDNGYVVIEVTDNGPGIPVEYQSKIFEKFFRLPSENVHNVKGYGLGLSFAALVIKLHKGTISMRNLEQGCSFTIKMPLA